MTIGAAEDRKTAKARINWLLRQLVKTPEARSRHCSVRATSDIQAPLDKCARILEFFAGRIPKFVRNASR